MSRRASQSAPKINQPHRRLNSFRRQLVAAFSSERQLRFSSSIESGAAKDNVHEHSKWRSYENHLEHATRINGNRSSVFKSGWTSSQARHFRSPKHLIRMFAERQDDSSNENADEHQQQKLSGINSNLMSLILETPTKAANCFKIDRFTATRSSDVDHVALGLRPTNERPPAQVAGSAAARAFNLPLHRANSNQLPPAPVLSQLYRSDILVSRSPSEAASTKTVLKKRAPPSSDARKLIDLLGSHEWRSPLVEPVDITKTSLFQLKLKLASNRAQDSALQHEALRLQHGALGELIDTELHYIERLKLMVDLFLGTLEHVQARLGLLTDIGKHQVASNVEQILEANLRLWEEHLNLESATGCPDPNPLMFADAFANLHHIFKPYYRFCIEQSSCTRFVRKLALKNDCFHIYLSWCEAQHECQRMKLADLLACPMQRLTRYSLLLRTILKQTPSEQLGQHECLFHMIALTDKFVKSVDLELRRRDDFLRLLRASNRLDLNQRAEDCGADPSQRQQILELLSRHYRRPDLMAPLFDCPSACLRQLIFDSSVAEFDGRACSVPLERLKFKDSQTASKLEIVLLIFTDQLIVCKQQQNNHNHHHYHHQQQQQAHNQRLYQVSDNPLGRRSSNYLASFKRHSMRLSKRIPAAHKTSSNANLNGFSFDKSYSPPVTPNECCKNYHSDNNFSTSAEEKSYNGFGIESCEQTNTVNHLSWPIKRRAASHSYLLGTNLFALGGSGCDLVKAEAEPGSSSLLSPVRAALRVPGQQALHQNSLESRLDRHQSRSSEQISVAMFNRHHGGSSSYEDSSNCSLISNQNHAVCDCRHDEGTSEQAAGKRFMSMRDYDLSAQSDNESAVSTHKQAKRDRHRAPMTGLLAIRPPYATEWLALHELADGQSVLFCQLNENRTIVNSFVVYCHARAKHGEKLLPSPRSSNLSTPSCPQSHCTFAQLEQQHQNGSKASAQSRRFPHNLTDSPKHATSANYHDDTPALSPAKRLILLVKEAQVRHRALVKLHGHTLAGTGNAEPPGSRSLYQNSLSLEVPSSPKHPGGYTHFRSNDSELDDISSTEEQGWRLRMFAEQHQLFLLNHGLHHELVTHEFTYKETGPGDFVVSAKSISPPFQRSLSTASKTVSNPTSRAPNRRPLLSRSDRSSGRLRDDGAVDSAMRFDHDHSTVRRWLKKDKSKSNGCLNHAELAADFESDTRVSSRSPPSLSANLSQSHLTDESNLPSPSRRGSRRTLNSLKRQNVILLASCEQHQLQTACDERESANPRPLRTGALESSSIDSVEVTGTTDNSFVRHGLQAGPHMMRRHESSPVQRTIDQTLENDEKLVGPTAHHHRKLYPIKSIQLMSLHHQTPASNEQASSPIAVTLTVPSRASFKRDIQRAKVCGDQTESVPQSVGSIDQEIDERQAGCLDFSKTFCRIRGGRGGDETNNEWRYQKRSPELCPKVPHLSRSPATRLQDLIQCLRQRR